MKQRKTVLLLLGIIILTAGLGLYIIGTAVLISQDGVRYIENAQAFGTNPINALSRHWPGYPFLIFVTHGLFNLFTEGQSILSWIYSGQIVSLLCRVLALLPLYFIGKKLVGNAKSLWGLLILVLLPHPAEFGSDVVREWPYLLFLSTSMALLMYGAAKSRWWMFGLAGLVAGIGHTIRPECAQVVIYGIIWLIICAAAPSIKIRLRKAGLLAVVLLVGFAIPAGAFMKIRSGKGEIIPNKLNHIINKYSSESPINQNNRIKSGQFTYRAESVPAGLLSAAGRLVQAVSENLMHFFLLPWVIGLFVGLRKFKKTILDERFFVLAVLILYTIMMLLLHTYWGYISRRHCLPMVVLSVFYVPVGLEIISGWLEVNIFRNKSAGSEDVRRVFLLLMVIGLAICIGKISRITPLRAEKQSYVQAAEWLKNNTKKDDRIAVFDSRIGLYSARKYRIIRARDKFPKGMDYIVKPFNKELTAPPGWEVYREFTGSEKKTAVYKKE